MFYNMPEFTPVTKAAVSPKTRFSTALNVYRTQNGCNQKTVEWLLGREITRVQFEEIFALAKCEKITGNPVFNYLVGDRKRGDKLPINVKDRTTEMFGKSIQVFQY